MPALRRFLSAAPLLAATFVLALPPAASADVAGSFIPLGPDGGTIDALAVDPLDPLTVYAGASDNGAGVFKSTDGGQSWVPLRNGIPLGGEVRSLAVDPSHPGTVYAGTSGLGIYKSTDGGASWAQQNQGLNTNNQFFALAVVPGAANVVLAASEIGVYRSVNGGATWATANQGLPSFPPPFGPFTKALVASATRAYAAVGGVFRSTDGGKTWSAASRGLPANPDVVALAISQQDGSLYAAESLQHTVFRSTDGGGHWTPASGSLAADLGVQALAVDPGSPATVYAATEQGVFRTDNRGADWKPASAGLTSHDVLALAVPRTGLLYAGTASISPVQASLGGVFQSSDGGNTWQRRSQGISTLFVTSLAAEPTTPATLWIITTAGLFRSGDGGSSWSQVDPGVSGSLLSVVADQDQPGTVYVVASSANSVSSLLVTHDSGATWQTLPVPAGAFFANISLDPRTHSLFLTGMGVYRSVDGGQTWTAAAGEIAGDFINQITPDLSTPGVLYAAGRTPPGPHLLPPPQARVFKSADGGATWLRSDAGLENVTNLNRILVLPNAPATLYALGDFSIFRSRDAGATWELAAQALPSPPQDLAAAADGTLFAATQGAGVLTSTDGQTWVPIDGVPAQFIATTLRFDPHNPRLLYVGSGDFGLVAIALAEPSVCPSGATSATALCLQGHRFQVEVAWSDFNGNTGAGQTLPGNDETGSFWFFDPNNTELVVKVLDGRLLNNHFWVFYASLTNVAYTLKVTDTATGAVRIYKNPLRHFGSAGDTEAF